jgi:drug/metabolite transporter (DMT)-like permease
MSDHPSPSTAVPKRGYLFVVLAAVLWAVSGSSAKFLFNRGITAFQLVQMRLTLASALLLIWFLWRKRPFLRVARRDLGSFILLGSVGMASVQFTYLFTISKIQVAAAILLEYLAPVLIAVHAVVFAHQRLTRTLVTALIGATAGCYLVVGGYNLDLVNMNRVGIISGLLSAVSFAAYAVYGEKLMCRYSSWTVLLYSLVFAALLWNVVQPPLGFLGRSYSLVEWAWILYIAVLGTIVPFWLYCEGINLIRSTRASITATLEPITAGLIAYLFLGEMMERLQLAGGILVIASIVLLQLRREYDDRTPALIRERLEHDASGVEVDSG